MSLRCLNCLVAPTTCWCMHSLVDDHTEHHAKAAIDTALQRARRVTLVQFCAHITDTLLSSIPRPHVIESSNHCWKEESLSPRHTANVPPLDGHRAPRPTTSTRKSGPIGASHRLGARELVPLNENRYLFSSLFDSAGRGRAPSKPRSVTTGQLPSLTA